MGADLPCFTSAFKIRPRGEFAANRSRTCHPKGLMSVPDQQCAFILLDVRVCQLTYSADTMLLNLCPELCEHIVGELHDDQAALCSLAITARVLKAPAQHILFNTVTLTGCNYEAFILSLLAHPYLAPLVRDLTIDGAVPSPLTTRPEALSALLSFLPSLQNLTIDGLSWMLAHPNASTLFTALYPSVERIMLRNSCVDFATSFRALLSSFPNAKSLEMDGSGAVCSGYPLPESEERKMDGLENVVLKGKCAMPEEVVVPLVPKGLKKLDVEVCDRNTLDMLGRVCTMSEELEKLGIELRDGGSMLGGKNDCMRPHHHDSPMNDFRVDSRRRQPLL
jgi:hypothetical protein